MQKRLAIITTHPIQYNAPLFQLLAKEDNLQIKIFYTWSQSETGMKYDPGFGKNIEWDIPLLEGYDYEFIKNISKTPGTTHFKGIDNPSLIEKILQWKPQAILVFGWAFKSHLAVMRYFKGKIPILFRGDSTLLNEHVGIKKLVRRVFLKWVYKHIDYALCVGTNNKNYFLAHGIQKKQLVFAPHAIDNNRFSENAEVYQDEANKWRINLNIKQTDFVVLFAGKLEAKKDPSIILDVADEIEDENIKFLLIGNGQMENDLKKRAMNNKKIVFLDFQNQKKMPIVYRIADVVVLPSKGPGETWGLAINEAMACGRAVIASDKCGGAIDLIQNGENGFIFKACSVVALKDIIKNMMVEKDKIKNMGFASINIIKKWSFYETVNAIQKIV